MGLKNADGSRVPWDNVVLIVFLLAAGGAVFLLPDATATHNSAGAPHMHLVDPNEVDEATGLLTPDIPHEDHPNPDHIHPDAKDRTSPYHLTWHASLNEDGLERRPAPIDQSGDRSSSCQTHQDYASKAEYHDALRNGEACYIGYMDNILEYSFPSLPLVLTHCPCDPLYPINPEPDDEHCTGEDDSQEFTDNEAIDQELTRLGRATAGGCGVNQHDAYLSGDLLVDINLLEAGLHEATGTAGAQDMGSGSFILDGFSTQYLFLLGQPHPDNDDPSPHQAGEGPFSASLDNLGSPFFEGWGQADDQPPCGQRTQSCRLLTPQDIQRYDPWAWSNEFDDAPVPEVPRVCAFLPQYTFSTPTDEAIEESACGSSGHLVDQFIPDTTHGGLGIDEGPPTWMTNLPGWSWGVRFTSIPTDAWLDYPAAYYGDDPDFPWRGLDGERPGFITYYAVNPIVPTDQSDLRCIVPGMLAHGDDSVLRDAGYDDIQDPGVYGSYRADAIDVDIYPHPFDEFLDPLVEDTQGDVRSILGPVQSSLEDASGTMENLQAVIGERVPRDVQDDATDAMDRADYLETRRRPEHAQPGENNQHPFQASTGPGLACDPAGQLRFAPAETALDAGLRFNVDIAQSTMKIKDPTVFDEDLLPERASNTHEGTWQVDVYSFEGQAQAVIDFNQDGTFGPCPESNVEPDDDLCPWESLWDAYSGNRCQNRGGASCLDLLDGWGYHTEKGVGAYFVLKVTGPVYVTSKPLTIDQERIQGQTILLGAGNPTGQNCIVGATIGFEQKLPTFFEDTLDTESVLGRLCEGSTDSTFLEDAFAPQSAEEPGAFHAQVVWVPMLATPSASGLGEGDGLCVVGVWSISKAVDYALDTAGENNINLEGGKVHRFGHWQSLETGTGTPADRPTC